MIKQYYLIIGNRLFLHTENSVRKYIDRAKIGLLDNFIKKDIVGNYISIKSIQFVDVSLLFMGSHKWFIGKYSILPSHFYGDGGLKVYFEYGLKEWILDYKEDINRTIDTDSVYDLYITLYPQYKLL